MAISPANSVRLGCVAALTGAAVLMGGLPTISAAQAVPTQTTTASAASVQALQVASAKQKARTKAQKARAKAKAKRQRAKRQASRARANRKRSSLVRVSLNKLGKQYVPGAAGPNSFDCSGFTMYIYKKALGKNLPHYSGAQMRHGKRVSQRNLKPGDLMFYGRGGSQHVSMYIGKGKMVHATNPRTDVRIDSIHNGYWRGRYAGARRIVQS